MDDQTKTNQVIDSQTGTPVVPDAPPVQDQSTPPVSAEIPIPAAEKPAEPLANQPPTAAAAPKSSAKILLIEDDPPMVKMYSTKFLQEGFQVEAAYDGEEGLKKINEWGPDLVLLDLMIPKIGGMDVLTQLRTVPKTKDLPVVILSNLSQDEDILRAKQLGVKEFLIKANYTPGQVVEKIRGVLGH